jgi:DNA-binding IclR family transcriptional regulator
MDELPIMAALPLGVFSRTEQRVLQAIFKAIADGDGCCVATLATLARASGTSPTTTRNAIARAVGIGLLEETEHDSYRLGSQAGSAGSRAAKSGATQH